MRERIEDFLLSCEAVDFGKPNLSKAESIFYHRFGNEMVSLCRSLPESSQTDAMLFLMRYSGLQLGDAPDFFANYYPPIWSVLYWICSDHPLAAQRLKEQDLTNAVTGQSMAMFLHSLDDHLTDGQVAVSSLTLLLRSQAWESMNRSFSALAEGVPDGEGIVRNYVDDYYAANQDPTRVQSLDGYCDLFRKQMGILMPAPVLLAMKLTGTSEFTKDIEVAYGSFGIAWRLLDDIKDLGEDIKKGAASAVYLCLPDDMKSHWRNNSAGLQGPPEESMYIVLEYVRRHGLVHRLKHRIYAELEKAAGIVEAHRMDDLAAEFRRLAHPFGTGGSTQEEYNG